MITITGKIIKDAETGTTKNDKHFLRFTLVCNSERWKDKITGEQKEKATFVNFIYFGEKQQTNKVKYLKKGTIVTIIPRQIETELYQKSSGETAASLKTVFNFLNQDNFKIHNWIKEDETFEKPAAKEQTAEIFTHETETTDELPF